MKQVICLLLISLVLKTATSQNYTIYKSGSNTWGGPYVPPVWGKTYDFNTPSYQSPAIKSGSSGNTYSAPAGSSSGSLSGYEKKKKWSVSAEAIDGRDRHKEMQQTLIEALDNYYAELIRVIDLFDQGFYKSSLDANQSLFYTATKTKKNFENYGFLGIYEKFNEEKYEFTRLEYYYRYLCNVKLCDYTQALETYNNYLSSYHSSSNPYDTKNLYPLKPEFYYLFDTINKTERLGFDDFSLENRFRGDLFLVETLAGLGKLTEAAKIMEATLIFYSPLINSFDDYNAQIAVNYFYLRKPDEAQKYLEYYCHKTQSNNARLAIVNELLFNSSSTARWNVANCAGCFKLIEDNMLFLDDLNSKGKQVDNLYSTKNWLELYINRSDNLDKFVAKAEPADEEFRLLGSGKIYYIEGLDYYLTALLKKQQEDKINKVMQKLAGAAEMKRKMSAEKSDTEMQEICRRGAIDSKQYYLDHANGYDKERAKTSRMYKTEYTISSRRWKESVEEKIKKYWESKYIEKARPSMDALWLFRLNVFASAGGTKYLQKYAAPYVNELSKYTIHEASYIAETVIEKCGLLPNFKKSRAYPKDLD